MRAFIAANRLTMSGAAMAAHLGLTKTHVNRYMADHGLTPPRAVIAHFHRVALEGRTSSTPDTDAAIRQHYLHMPVKALARHIGRSTCFTLTRMRQLGLEVPEALARQRGKASWFKKGSEPFSKGRKQAEFMSAEGIERTRATRFKKGNEPHNTRADMERTIRISADGKMHYWIRLGKCKWQPLHVYNWLKAGNTLPQGHILRFKDGNTLNPAPGNLAAITRAEHARMNRGAWLAGRPQPPEGQRPVRKPAIKAAKEKEQKAVRKMAEKERKRMMQQLDKKRAEMQKAEKRRARERAFASRYMKQEKQPVPQADLTGKIAVRLNHKTIVYVKPGTDIAKLKEKYGIS